MYQLAPQQEPDQRDVPGVQALEVDARAEHPPAPVAGVGHRAAAQDAHLRPRIEERHVDGGLHVVHLLVVLGVQAVVAAHGEIRRAALPLHPDRPCLEDARAAELGQQP